MAHEGLWEQLIELDGCKAAQRANCRYIQNLRRYIVKFLHTEFVVDLSNKKIFSGPGQSDQRCADFLQQLCILTYLINAKDLLLANKLIGAEALPAGQFFFRGIHKIPTEKLVRAFSSRPETLSRVAEQFGAKRCEFGDASIKFNVLPRIPLTIVIWKGDEEFQARASVLFDQTAADHLPLDALLAAVNLVVEALVKAAEDELVS